jgi:hypothetical protein
MQSKGPWIHSAAVPNLGTVTFIQPPHQGNRSLPKPYEFCLSLAKAGRLAAAIKALDRKNAGKTQFDTSLSTKKIAYGIRFDVFLLGCNTGAMGDSRGTSREEWNDICDEFDRTIEQFLGSGIIPYREAWRKNRKFQYRWHGYVMYKELAPKGKRAPGSVS